MCINDTHVGGAVNDASHLGNAPVPGSDVLVHQDRVAVRVDRHEAGRPSAVLVRFTHQLYAFRLQLPLQLTHVRKGVQRTRLAVPNPD